MIKKYVKALVQRFEYTFQKGVYINMDVRQMRNFQYITAMCDLVKKVEGSIVECGVGKGRTLLYFCYHASQYTPARHVWGFDSFEGFPEVHMADQSDRAPKKGEWSDTSRKLIFDILRYAGIQKDFIQNNIHVIPGFFEASLKHYSKKPIALLHVDVDLYESYQAVLNELFEYVVPGGIVMFDEYNDAKWPGATKAVDEFLRNTSYELQQHPFSKKYYFIKE